MKLIHRRTINCILLLVAMTSISVIWQLGQYSFSNQAFVSGWLLFGSVMLLFLLTLRKRIVGGSFFKVSVWLQMHIYLGLLTVYVFLLHAGPYWPEGNLKQLLYLLFVLEVVSGMVGLFISRKLPPYLARGEHVLYQNIRSRQQQICEQAEKLVKSSLQQTDSNTIGDFFQQHLLAFFLKPQHFWAHIFQSKKTTHTLEADMQNLHRYLNEDERQIINRLHELVIEKDQLDYQYAGQTLLKRWLFIHVPVSYALLLFAVLHVTLVYAYIGGS